MDNMNFSEKCDGILNLSNPLVAENIFYASTEILFITVVLPLVVLIGVSSNSAFIFVVIRVKRMQTITNAYLTNVAVADMIFVGYSCSAYLVTFTRSPVRDDVFFETWAGCMGNWLTIAVGYFASLMLIALVTIEKYYALCHPLRHMTITGKGRTTKLLVVSWTVGVILAILGCLRYAGIERQCVIWPDAEQYDNKPMVIEFCTSNNPALNIFADITAVVPFVVVFICSLYMYARIIQSLSSRPIGEKLDSSDRNNSQAVRALRVRNQVARLLIINGMIFFCCQAPYRITQVDNIWLEITGARFMSPAQGGTWTIISRVLILINSCVNPFVYYTSSSYYRSAFKEAFGKRDEQTVRNKRAVATVSTRK